MSIYREINQNVIQALAEARLLHWQIAAQAVAIRMPFAGSVVTMCIGRCIMIVITTRICRKRGQRPGARSRVLHIMPATSKQCMDEQRGTQQATKNGTHEFANS